MKDDQSEKPTLFNCVQRWKVLGPQIFAVSVAASLNVFTGRTVALAGLLVEQPWSTAVCAFATLIFGLLSGIATDFLGRVLTVVLAAIPGVLGLITIAVSDGAVTTTIGKVLTTLSIMLISTATVVYISDVTRKDVRGAGLVLVPLFVSLGTVLVYIESWFLNWRLIASLSLVYLLIPVVALRFLHESPLWLVSKKSVETAKESLKWFNKFVLLDQHKVDTLVEFEVEVLEEEVSSTASASKTLFYKPLVLVAGISLFQQLSGTTLAVSNMAWFFEVNRNYVELLKIMVIACCFLLMTRVGRRSLLLNSTLATVVVAFAAGVYLQLCQGTLTHQWILIVLTVTHFCLALLGTISTFVLTAEVFPIGLKGTGFAAASVVINVMFLAVFQFYSFLNFVDGLSYHAQYLCALFAMVNVVLVYVFLLETHDCKFSDIAQHFSNNNFHFTTSMRRTFMVPLLNER